MQGIFAILQTSANYIQRALSRSVRHTWGKRRESPLMTSDNKERLTLSLNWSTAFQPSPNERTVKLYSLQSIDISLTQQPRFFFHQHVKLHSDAGQTLHKPLQIRARGTDVLLQSRSLFSQDTVRNNNKETHTHTYLPFWTMSYFTFKCWVHFLRLNYSQAFGNHLLDMVN